MARRAFDGMVRRAHAAGDLEVGGFLLGGYHHHQGQRFVEVAAQVPALRAQSARAHLTFSNEVVREFHETHAARYPGTTVLGWYHTHPGYGLFLSADDQFIQTSFYAAEHHVAIVIDPRAELARSVGVFVWEAPGRLADRPYAPIVYEDVHRRRTRRQRKVT